MLAMFTIRPLRALSMYRDTALEPTRSGVIGLICAAIGIARGENISRFDTIRMGVRVDVEGRVSRDYHIAQHIYTAGGATKLKESEPSTRYYLADAAFLVGLEGEDVALLRQLHQALQAPVWPLFLGRKAFVPATSVHLADGLRPTETLEEALRSYPWLGRATQNRREKLRLVLEESNGPEVRQDQPLSFARREFAPRRVRVTFTPVPTEHLEEV